MRTLGVPWLRFSPNVRQVEVDVHLRQLAHRLSPVPRPSHGGWLIQLDSSVSPEFELLLFARRRWATLCASALVTPLENESARNAWRQEQGLMALPAPPHGYELILGQHIDLSLRADLTYLEAIGRSLAYRVEQAARRLLAAV
jgi:hypothetical protein